MLEKPTLKNKPGPAIDQAKDLNFIRVFLNDEKEGTFICPACNNGVIKHLGAYFQAPKAIRLKCKCKCGHVYRALVERRRIFRKPVNFSGTYYYSSGEVTSRKGPIRVLDISQFGLQFSLNSTPTFNVGDRIIVEFIMDERSQYKIREMGIVKDIRTNKVGMQFGFAESNGELNLHLI